MPPNITTYNLYQTNKIKLTWDPIPRELENGRMTGYKITYQLIQKFGRDAVVSETTYEATVDRFTFGYVIEGLYANSVYRVTLCGYSPQGDGPKFEELLCKFYFMIKHTFYLPTIIRSTSFRSLEPL